MRLTYRSRSIHELVLHQLCEDQGLYAAAGVTVVHEDGSGRRWAEAAAAPDAATVAVGGVVGDWLRGDADWRVHFVATVRPLMWVVGTEPITEVGDLRARRIAVPPLAHMPSVFLRLLLARHGLDISTDVIAVEVDQRPDRQRLLDAGDVDAALVGPEGLLPGHLDGDGAGASGGAGTVLWVGAHVEYPTVGLATRSGVPEDEAAAAAAALGQGLTRLRADPEAALAAMRAVEPDVSEAVARWVQRVVIAPTWDGPAWARRGGVGDVPAVAAALGVAVPPDGALRSFLHGWTGGSVPSTEAGENFVM